MALKFFKVETDEKGITVVTFDRPPVNAVSVDVFPEIKEWVTAIQSSDDTRVVVWTASPAARAWCGGADIKDLASLNSYEARLARYDIINECFMLIYNLDRPLIAAINGHALGMGMVLASLCDMRIAAAESFFGLPEIDRGVMAGGISFYARLGVANGKIREMTYTGRRFTGQEMSDTGFFNYVVPKDQVMAKALELAGVIATKSLPALRANKICANNAETMNWKEGFVDTQKYSAKLTIGADAKEGLKAFLEKRDPAYKDK